MGHGEYAWRAILNFIFAVFKVLGRSVFRGINYDFPTSLKKNSGWSEIRVLTENCFLGEWCIQIFQKKIFHLF